MGKRTEKPPTVYAKMDLVELDAQETVDVAQSCLNTRDKSPLAPQLGVEIAELQTANDALTGTLGRERKLQEELLNVGKVRIEETATLKQKVKNFGNKAAQASKGNAVLLATCAIEAAQPRKPRKVVEIGQIAVKDIGLNPGAEDGELILKYPRLPGTTAVEIQYKAASASSTDPWLPQDYISTNALTWTLTGLGHKQEVRVRIRGIGATRGPWSEDALGRAR